KEIRQPPVDDLAVVLHAGGFELLGELRILDARRRELFVALGVPLFQGAANHLIGNGDFGDLPGLEEALELAIRDRAAARGLVVQLHEAEYEEKCEAIPERGGGTGAELTRTPSLTSSRVETRRAFAG